MKLVLIVGNGAVGKMTVGQELAKITDLRLNFNHLTIDPITEIFGYPDWELILEMRDLIMARFAKSEAAGMIATFMWGFDIPSDWDYIEQMCKPFRDVGAEIYCVELVAPQEVRLERNISENRLQHKPSKRNLEQSRSFILQYDDKGRFESLPGEIENGRIPFDGYMRLENTNISAAEAAQMVKERFEL